MRVIGFDLSLTSTGLALVTNGRLTDVGNVKSSGKKTDTYADHMKRIDTIADEIELFWCRENLPDLAVIESPSHGSKFGLAHERAGLWWAVYSSLVKCGVPVGTVAPQTRAKYITGNGRAGKDVVLAFAIEQYVRSTGPRITNDDIADATGLAAMGSRHLGEPIEVRSISDAQLAAMDGAKWPTT